MTVLHHAFCGDDFHQTPGFNTISEKCFMFFFSGFVGDATQVLRWQNIDRFSGWKKSVRRRGQHLAS